MKIGILAYPHYDFPPNGYGPMQLIACELAEGLAKRDYQVSIFATANAKLSKNIKIIPTKDTSVSSDPSVPDPKIYEFVTIQKLIEHRNNFDILSSHIGFHILPFIEFLNYPVIVNLQGDYSNEHYYNFVKSYDAYFVSISKSQQRELPRVNFSGCVYHGINLKKFPFKEKSGDYLSFLGRVSPVKGIDVAIKVAASTNLPLRIGAKYDKNNPDQNQYYNRNIKPYLNNKIKFLGEQNFSQKINLLSGSRVLVFPIKWQEAFGLVMVEAMACGTPVVAFNRGSVPEIIKDGETGYICPPDDIGAMVKAVKKIYQMPVSEYQGMRKNCRQHVEENFTIEKMVDGYEKVYKNVIADYRAKL